MIRTVPRQTERPRGPTSDAAQCLRARIAITSLLPDILECVAYDNDCDVYGSTARAELARRARLESEDL